VTSFVFFQYIVYKPDWEQKMAGFSTLCWKYLHLGQSFFVQTIPKRQIIDMRKPLFNKVNPKFRALNFVNPVLARRNSYLSHRGFGMILNENWGCGKFKELRLKDDKWMFP